MTTAPIALENPRWPNGPSICPIVNLPAFDTRKELNAYFEKYCPSIHIVRIGLCGECGKYHAEGDVA
jgi:hypothetical protein